MDRPGDLFDRHHEWDDLVAFAGSPELGTRLALLRGRRRQGKSYLLRRLAEATNGFYYQAVDDERGQALRSFGAALGSFLRVPGGRLTFDTWDDALNAIADASANERIVVALDEFPYLLAHSPELPSLLQRFIDRTRGSGAVRLILCGSALSVMSRLLEGTQALRGRASTDVVVRPFDFRRSANYWNIADPTAAFLVHAVVGGTPGYRDLLAAQAPRSERDFRDWLARGPLNPSSAMFREDDYLLTEERTLSDRRLYHSVVTAVAAGATSQGQIARDLGREQRAIQHPLRALEECGFVLAEDDALRARRPIYRIADPIVRFHHVVTRADLARFEDRRTAAAWADAVPRFRTHVLGPQFEDIARDFAFRYALPSTVGGTAASVGAAVINDAAGRAQHQLDVVVLGRETDGSNRVQAIGEAKYTEAQRGTDDLVRLERIRDLVARKSPTAAHARLLIFSANGFQPRLSDAVAGRSDVELIDLRRLYHGN